MYRSEKVKINVAMVERILSAHNLTLSEFSQKMGHGRTWWNGVKLKDGYTDVNKAKLLCHVLGVDYSKIVIPEPRITSNANPCNEQKPLYADDESIQGLVNSINNIELAVKRLEIQMRTILKELGVK